MENVLILKDLDPVKIQEYQRNQYPCFFIDKIEYAIPGKEAKGYKNFTFNEWFFPAHFSDEPNVPGFVQVEMLTQVFLMTFLTFPETKGKKTGFVSIDNARFYKKIVPGDRVDIKADLNFFRHGIAKGKSAGYIHDELACQISVTIAIPDIMKQFLPKT